MTVQALRARLSSASPPERLRLLAKVLREARDTEVWLFTSPQEVAQAWPVLAPRLGLRRAFWEFLLSEWERQGRIELNRGAEGRDLEIELPVRDAERGAMP